MGYDSLNAAFKAAGYEMPAHSQDDSEARQPLEPQELSFAEKALQELEQHRPGKCLIDPYFFQRHAASGRCVREHATNGYLRLRWGDKALPIQGGWLTAHFRRILLVCDEFGRKAVPDAAFWVNMVVAETKNGNASLRQAKARDVALTALITEYVYAWEREVSGTVRRLAVIGSGGFADDLYLLMVGSDACIAGVGGFDDLCSIPPPHERQ